MSEQSAFVATELKTSSGADEKYIVGTTINDDHIVTSYRHIFTGIDENGFNLLCDGKYNCAIKKDACNIQYSSNFQNVQYEDGLLFKHMVFNISPYDNNGWVVYDVISFD